MKKYLTLQEILALNIPDFPNSRQALDYKAKKEDWEYIEVKGNVGKGGVSKAYRLPTEYIEVAKIYRVS